MLDQPEIQVNYPGPSNKIYVNTSSCGLIAKSSIEKAQTFLQGLHENGSFTSEKFLGEQLPGVRKKISTFLGADTSEIALIPNFSFGLNAIIPSLLKYKKVLLLEDDYPSLTQPFILNDFETFWVKNETGFGFSLDKIASQIKQNQIKIIAVSHVQYLSGFMIDLEALGEICKANDAILIVDGTQSLGAFPFSFQNSLVDIFITSNYKWMNAGFGTGIMAIKREFLENHPPKIGGFASFVGADGSWGYTPSILGYEPGHLNMSGLLVLEDALDIKMKIGIDNIYKHIKQLLQQLIEQIDTTQNELIGAESNENRCGIICFKENPKLLDRLNSHHIIYKSRNGNIRLGIHFHNSEEDINQIVKAIND